MDASSYAVSFGYGATDGQYYYTPTAAKPKGRYWVGNYHRGNDRPTPTGTPLIVGGVLIGRTGATGAVSGAHLHSQAGTDAATQNTIDPTPYEFKAGTVVARSTVDAGQWGKYITVRVGDRYITYAHLSVVYATVGQVLKPSTKPPKGGDMITKGTLTFIFDTLLGRKPDAGAIRHYVGNFTTDFVIDDVSKSTERQSVLAKQRASSQKAAKADAKLKSDVASLTKQVAELKQGTVDPEEVAGLKSHIADLQVRVEDMTAELNAKDASIDQLSKAAQIKDNEIDRLQKTQGNVADMSLGQLLSAAFGKLFKIK